MSKEEDTDVIKWGYNRVTMDTAPAWKWFAAAVQVFETYTDVLAESAD